MPKVLLPEMMAKRKMSKYRLALLTKKPYKHINRWFEPDYDPKLSVLALWAKALKCRIRDLYRE